MGKIVDIRDIIRKASKKCVQSNKISRNEKNCVLLQFPKKKTWFFGGGDDGGDGPKFAA